ncbi:MAG: M48 family metallopeptidase [Acidobacteriota bacterium]
MADPNPNSPVCSNGHRQPAAGTKFCIYCGVPIVYAAAAAVPPVNIAPAPPVQPVPFVTPPDFNPNHIGQAHLQNFAPVAPVTCRTCGGHGEGLPQRSVICSECNWLRPLVPGYQVDAAAFAWAADAKAMAALRKITPLNAAAKAVSEKVGRRWVEVAFNGVLLGEKQLPQIYGQAVRSARILGMSHMPDVYISGDRAWDCLTFGTDRDSFIILGSALAGNFQGVDLLFLLAREMGHCRAGHALWKTVIRFFLGEQGPSKGFMAGGIFNAIMSPTHLIGGAMEMPLLAWARQAEITADRAGLLAVGSEEVARRVLLSWTLRSSVMFKQLNIEEWINQQDVEDDAYTKLSEVTTSSTPYIGPRLKLLAQYARSPELKHYLTAISESIRRAAPPPPPPKPKPTVDPDILRFKCSTCGTPMRVPRKVLEGKEVLAAKCPDAKCGAITQLRKNVKKTQQENIAIKRELMGEDPNYAD